MMLVFEIARQTLLLQMRSKLYWILMALAVGFAGMFLFVPPNAAHIEGNDLFDTVCFVSGFTLVLPFIVLYMAVQAIHGDIEDRTSVYLFTRPVSRAWILLGKWLAVLVLGGVFSVVSISALYLVIRCSGRPWAGGALPTFQNFSVYLMAAGMGVAGYSTMGMLLGAYFRRPMLLSMFYIVAQEFASRMPPQAGIHSATVADPVRRFLVANLDDLGWGLHKFLDGRLGQDRGEVASMFGDPVTSLTKLVAVTMVLALWVYVRREYDARSEE